jgi:hypothetical protein
VECSQYVWSNYIVRITPDVHHKLGYPDGLVDLPEPEQGVNTPKNPWDSPNLSLPSPSSSDEELYTHAIQIQSDGPKKPPPPPIPAKPTQLANRNVNKKEESAL